MSYADAGHRPHGTHFGEEPDFKITNGPESINVTLDTWGPRENIFPTIYDALQANWGDVPSRTIHNTEIYAEDGSYIGTDWSKIPRHWDSDHAHVSTGMYKLNPQQRAYVESCFAGRTLPQILELISFEFTIDGVTRAFTHQTVRTRIGAAFMQHGGRDNDWRHRDWTMPETIRRACQRQEGGTHDPNRQNLLHCITTWKPILDLINDFASDLNIYGKPVNLNQVIHDYLIQGKKLYAALVDAGIPWQDARRLLPIGTQTYIHEVWNYLALQNMLAKRLEFVMDWEHVCVAQLMVREINMKCPPLFGKYLRSLSDRQMRAAFSGLESWPPDMKYDPSWPCKCGHDKKYHVGRDILETMLPSGYGVCWACISLDAEYPANSCNGFVAADPLTRTHRPEQNPFWVLHPDSITGGPIKWVATNGVYPKEF